MKETSANAIWCQCELEVTELDNKVVASTFHSAKGRERSLVIVMGFDASYFQYYAVGERQDRCPNALYVALTRAKDELILVRAYNKEHLPFLDLHALEATCESIVLRPAKVSSVRRNESASERTLSVTDLLDYCSYNTFKYLTQFYTAVYSDINIESHISAKSIGSIMNKKAIVENVANLNGIIGPLLFEYHRNGTVACAATLQIEAAKPTFKLP